MSNKIHGNNVTARQARLDWLRTNDVLWQGRVLNSDELHNIHAMMQTAALFSRKSDAGSCRVEEYIHLLGGKTWWNTEVTENNNESPHVVSYE